VINDVLNWYQGSISAGLLDMTENKPDKSQHQNNKKAPGMALLGGFAFVVLLLLIMYLGKQLRTIEDGLIHRTAETTFGIDIAEGQIVYVPIYSNIETDTGKTHPLYSILGIRNSDPERSIIITSASFYDGRGNLVKQYLDEHLELAPFVTRTFFVNKKSIRASSSAANFIITWKSDAPVYEPIIDAVTYGSHEGMSISFKSVGRPLVQRIE
jgi:hypothetical protein